MAVLTVWTEPLAESNCYILEEQGRCLVIDPNDAEGPTEILVRRGWTPELVFLTHEHCDHMAGLEALRARWPEARALATEACSANLASSRLNMSAMMEAYLTFRGKPGIRYEPFTCRPADITWQGIYNTEWRGHALRCVSLPGHTPGSAALLLDGEAIFSGDYLIPDEDVILRFPGGSEKEYREKTRPFLAALPEGITVYPGHRASYCLTRG